MAWEEIAKRMNLSKTRVMQIYAKALLKIKAILKEPEFIDIQIDYEAFLDNLDTE